MRELVSIEQIINIQPIEGADNIEVATVKGWKVVVKKSEFNEGDMVVYFEVDSWIPKELAPFLKSNAKTTEYLGVEGALLKTVKLRGQISQGLLLSIDYVNEYLINKPTFLGEMSLSDRLGVTKFELPTNDNTGYQFPNFVSKSDQERVQNIPPSDIRGSYEVTEKLDGWSMTVFFRQDDQTSGVCSRNVMFRDDVNNHFTQAEKSSNLITKIRDSGLSIAIQGELIGPKIRDNPYKLKSDQFYCYAIFDIDRCEYWLPSKREYFCEEFDISHVPVFFDYDASETPLEDLLTLAEGQSSLSHSAEREGIVLKSLDTVQTFKVISNSWLLKQK